MVYFNGAEITNMPDGTPFYPALLRLEAVDFCVDISRSTGAYFQVYIPETAETPRKVLVAEKSTDETVMYFNHTGTRTVIGDLKQLLATHGLTGCIKAMFLTSPALQEVICSRLLEKFGESISVARTLSTFLEVMASGVSKGEGLRRVLEQCNLRPDEVLAFGDEENDLPLFAAAGFSVAPANAKESVRDAANMLIAPNAEDGVAAFLEDTFTGA
jgi:hydroxymethylpyrimidine pyrophosphatase-like HAD family hydrolase